MDTRNNYGGQKEFEHYLDTLISKPEKEEKTKSRKKFWLKTAAVIAAVTVAGTAIGVGVAGANPQDSSAGTVKLTYADDVSLTSEDLQLTSGFVLTDVSGVVEEALPAVVSVTSRALVDNLYSYRYYGTDINDIFDYFFGDSSGGRSGRGSGRGYQEEPETIEEEPEEVDYGLGSGTIIAKTDTELLVLTSYHVVEGSSSMYVTFINDVSVDGYLKAANEEKDIAVVAIPLKDIDAETLSSIRVAPVSKEEAKVGEGVIIIGNALGYGISVTDGIVSALHRPVYVEGMELELLQTNAAINSGNSGGCMLNSRGEIIGICEAKVTISYVEGMCYAIPVYDNLDLIESLMNGVDPDSEKTEVPAESGNGQAFLGIIRGRDVTSDLADDFGMPEGVYVYSTVAGGGAEDAGILSGDIIVGLDDQEIRTFEELQYALNQHNPGDTVTLKIMRLDGGAYASMEIEVTLTERIG